MLSTIQVDTKWEMLILFTLAILFVVRLAVVALCSEGVVCQREQHKLTLDAASLNTHVARLNHASNAPADPTDSQSEGQHTDAIIFQKESVAVTLIVLKCWIELYFRLLQIAPYGFMQWTLYDTNFSMLKLSVQ